MDLYMGIIEVRESNKTTVDDPNISLKASTVREYFVGYKYVVQLRWTEEYTVDVIKTSSMIESWCLDNCTDKFAHDIHRVIKSESYSGQEEYVFSGIVGEDLWFWAFKNEYDALLFALRW